MSSIKALLCDLCVILVLGSVAANIAATNEKPRSPTAVDNTPRGICICGGFPTVAIESDGWPLISQRPGLEANCDDEGENTCKQLCIALATAAKAKGPEVLCVRLKNAEELKLSAFSKICDRPWTYADMTADEPLCCADSKVKVCASAEKTNATDVGVADPKTVS